MSDFIICPLNDSVTMLDDATYVRDLQDNVQIYLKEKYNLSKGDMISCDAADSVYDELNMENSNE